MLTESFTDGDDFNDADKWNHNDSKTKVLHRNKVKHLTVIQSVAAASLGKGFTAVMVNTLSLYTLASDSVVGGRRDGHLGLYRSLCGMAPVNLAADCQLSYEEQKKAIISTVSCVLPTRGLVSLGGHTATLGTEVSRLPALGRWFLPLRW